MAMQTKHVVYSIAGVGAAAALAFFAWRRWGGAFATTDSAAVAAPVAGAASNAPVPYSPTAQNYAPIPVGVNTGSVGTSPPGVPSAQVTLPNADPGNAQVHPAHYGPSASDVTNAAGNTVATSTGQAAVPLPNVTTAPANIGNADLINQEYQRVFGHQADAAGLAFWDNAMRAGAVTAADLDRNLARGAQGSDISAVVAHDPALYVSAYTPK